MALPNWGPSPRPLPEIVAALGVEAVETLWHDKGYALVILADETAVRAARPDGRAVAALGPYVLIVSARGETTAPPSAVVRFLVGKNDSVVTSARSPTGRPR